MGDSAPALPLELWTHPSPEITQMWLFKLGVEKKYNVTLRGYRELYDWSIQNIAEFWRETCIFAGLHASARDGDLVGGEERVKAGDSLFDQILPQNAPMYPRPDFFPDIKLNFAENVLYPLHPAGSVKDDDIAIIAATETTRAEVTWSQLREKVTECYFALRFQGVEKGDRIAGFIGHNTNAIVAMLATTAIGAIWTAVSPDTGVGAVLDRLEQIEPKVLFADNASLYNGKTHETTSKVREIVASLPKLKVLVIIEAIPGTHIRSQLHTLKPPAGIPLIYEDFIACKPYFDGPVNVEKQCGVTKDGVPCPKSITCKTHSMGDKRAVPGRSLPYDKLLEAYQNDRANFIGSKEIKFERFPADHPVYILYSSGTTGKPKCIVHSAGGTLVQHKKEHIIHGDILPKDRLFYFTTTTWMMWHWLVSGLSCGATLVLYDGSPFYPHGSLTMPKLIDELQIKQFGTSAKYLSVLEQRNVFPKEEGSSLASLRAIYSTGSPLAPSTFKYITTAFGSQVQTASITGGTDIISLFGAPCALTPVYIGEIQQKGLGMAIAAVTPSGEIITTSQPGDLVCTKPFPSQPTTFYGPSGAEKYRTSYFTAFPGLWHHGDFVKFNPQTGGIYMLGRSDGILKPSGVRFGSAEIYNLLLKFFGGKVEEGLCIGRRREGDDDEVVVLFLRMCEGVELDGELKMEIKGVVRRELSARHVPGVIDVCFDIPVTGNGKKVEVAVKQILCGINVQTNASVANAECLEWYREWARKN